MDSKREDIIQAAIALFSKKGFAAASVEEIARESGMAKASFYKYFQGKHELPFVILERLATEIERGIKVIHSQSELSPREKLFRIMRLYLDQIISNKVHLLVHIDPFVTIDGCKMDAVTQSLELRLLEWLRVDLLEVYGADIEDNVWDITFILMSLVFESIRFFGDQMNDENTERIALFAFYVLEIMVEGMRSGKIQPYTLWGTKGWYDELVTGTPLQDGREIAAIFDQLADEIRQSRLSSSEKDDYAEILEQIKKETSAESPSSPLLKALIAYLENYEKLEKYCSRLRELLLPVEPQ